MPLSSCVEIDHVLELFHRNTEKNVRSGNTMSAVGQNIPHSGNIMNTRLHKRWTISVNRALLAGEGMIIGLCCACVICCFRLARDNAAPLIAARLSGWKEHWWIAPLWLVVLIVAARLLGWLVKKVPLISGSGIPQTELIVRGRLHISRMDWLKVLPAKFIGCLISTLGGLSLGREGPCIQMGAATAALLTGLWERFTFSGHIHMAAGAAAGMTAAFGAPVAGLLFVFEEMKSRFTWGGLIAVGCSAATAALATRYLFGFGLIFPFQDIHSLPLTSLWLLPVMGVAMGAAGVLYNKALLGTKNAEALHTPLSQNWRILPPLLASFVLTFVCPSVLGGGEELAGSLIRLTGEPGNLLSLLFILTALKISFSLFSYTGNVPGGILMPMLCIGALLGALCGQLLAYAGLISPEQWNSFIIYGMVGFFVSMVRVPLTGTALVMEMSGALTCLPGALIVAFLASWTANALHCPPVYDSLRAAIVISQKK